MIYSNASVLAMTDYDDKANGSFEDNELFDTNKIELGIGMYVGENASLLNSENLFIDEAVCAASKNNPLIQRPITLSKLMNAKHLNISMQKDFFLSNTDKALKERNLKRNIVVTAPDIMPALRILSKTQLIAMLPKRIVENLQSVFNLKMQKSPIKIFCPPVQQIWHRKQDNDAGLIWLRALVKSVC